MKGRQVRFVLMALIAVGFIGLIIRVVSSGSEEVVLSGLLPISPDVINKVTLSSSDEEGQITSEAELVRFGETWRIGTHDVFSFKLDRFWESVAQIDGAQLIATNPDNHERMGVVKDQGTIVSFYLGPSIQEQLIVGEATPDVRLCYLRRAGKDEVYGIPCPFPKLFDPDPDGWRNPIVATIPTTEVDSVTFSYPDEEFVLKISRGVWVVASGDEEQSADFFQVSGVLSALEFLVASGFANEEETKGLKFDPGDVSVRVVTKQGSTTPTTRLRFLERDADSYYLRTPTQPTVFILDRDAADTLLKTKDELLAGGGG